MHRCKRALDKNGIVSSYWAICGTIKERCPIKCLTMLRLVNLSHLWPYPPL